MDQDVLRSFGHVERVEKEGLPRTLELDTAGTRMKKGREVIENSG